MTHPPQRATLDLHTKKGTLMTYRETLNKWAERFVPEGSRVTHVDVNYDEGYAYSSYTFENPHTDFVVEYVTPGGSTCFFHGDENHLPTLGELLTDLFAIEDDAKLSVGDTVRVTELDSSNPPEILGRVGTLSYIDGPYDAYDSDMPYHVRFENNYGQWVRNVEKVTS